MAKELGLLLKIRFMSQLKINTLFDRHNKKAKRKQLLMIVTYLFLTLLGIVYCVTTAYGLAQLGLGQLIPVYSFTLASLITLFFTIFQASGELFAFKEYEQFMALPLKISTIIASRLLYLYLWNTLFSAIVMGSMGSIYLIYEKPGALICILWFVSIFFTSLIPTTIATIIGALIAWFASKTKHTSLMVILLNIGLIIAILMSSFMGGQYTTTIDLAQLEQIYRLVGEKVSSVYPLASLYDVAITEGNIFLFFAFLLLSISLYWGFVTILSLKYKQINTALTSFNQRADYQLVELKQSTVLSSLYRKELNYFFSSAVYVTNTMVGLILAVIFSSVFVFYGQEQLLQMIDEPQLIVILPKILPFLLSAMIAMSCTSCVSLSLEGKNLWLLQSLPLTEKAIYTSKLLVNLTFTVPGAILCGSLIAIGLKATIIQWFFMLGIPLVYASLTSVWGLWVNYHLVNYTWESETQVVKQSAASMLGMLGGLCLVLFSAIPVMFFSETIYFIYCIVIIFAGLLITWLLYRFLVTRKIPNQE